MNTSPNKTDHVTSSGDRLALFSEYRRWIDRLLVDLDGAHDEIVMEMYIFEPDGAGSEVALALMRAAQRGVQVRVMYDGLGSETTPSGFFDELRDSGITVRAYNPLEPWSKSYSATLPFRRRNHRKLTVIDGCIGHLGGMNLSGRFIDWADLSLRIEGPAVRTLRQSHQAVWDGRYRKWISHPWRRPGPAAEIRVLDNFANPDYSPIKRHYLTAINKARTRILLAQGYFFPDKRLRKALRKAARRGVSVEVVAPEKSDIRAVDYAAHYIYGKLLRDGVKIFLLPEPMLHAKAAVIDDHWMTLGSANLDPISLFSCLEINVSLRHRPLIAEATAVIEGYQRRATPLSVKAWFKRSWGEKFIAWLWYSLRLWFGRRE